MNFLTSSKTFFKDIIHNSIEISLVAKAIIDTPIFQRLRYLHQMGVCYLIYPNANNNRFEHSIGTYHLAGLVLERLKKNSTCYEINKSLMDVKFIRKYLLKNFRLEDTEENKIFLVNINTCLMDDYLIELIKIAGLIHDIGHGPFSHLFDEWIHSINSNNELIGTKMLEHEDRSVLLFHKIITDETIKSNDNEYYISDYINSEAFDFISELINPTDITPTNFIFQIISNSLNGLDVDKLDYLYRDSFYLGLGNPFDLLNVISRIQVIDSNICFPEDISYDIYKIFRSRYDLHKQFYTCKTTICIEYMIRDILTNLEPILNISSIIKNNQLDKFIELTDSTVLDTAKILKEYHQIYQLYNEQIDLIQKIIKKINTRDIYKCVYSESFQTDEITSNDEIFNKYKDTMNINTMSFHLDSSKLKIVKLKIGLLGGNTSHPLDTVYFYNSNNKSILLAKTKISPLLALLHQEIIYYIICKT